MILFYYRDTLLSLIILYYKYWLVLCAKGDFSWIIYTFLPQLISIHLIHLYTPFFYYGIWVIVTLYSHLLARLATELSHPYTTYSTDWSLLWFSLSSFCPCTIISIPLFYYYAGCKSKQRLAFSHYWYCYCCSSINTKLDWCSSRP